MPTRLQVYESSHIRVTYDPAICRNSGLCMRTLPAVFGERGEGGEGWIHADQAPADRIVAVVARCPSGALKAQYVTSVVPTAKRGRRP